MSWIAYIILLLGSNALAARSQLAVISVNDRVSPADPVTIEALTLVDGAVLDGEAPTLSMDGKQLHDMKALGEGRWTTTLNQMPPDGGKIEAYWRGVSTHTSIQSAHFLEAAIAGPASVATRTGRTVTIPIEGILDGSLDPRDVQVWSKDGSSVVETTDTGQTQIVYEPLVSPYPRSVPLIVTHARHLRARPYMTVVQISAQPTIPVQTEPGAEVSMTVGGREYGPLTADPTGRVSFEVNVPPGTDKAEVSLKDTLGNQQTSSILLGGSTGPQISIAHTGSLIAGGVTPTVYVSAATSKGSAWAGKEPTCTGMAPQGLRAIQAGLWLASARSAGSTDQRIECKLPGGAATEIVVPIERSRATRLVLQSYPSSLSTDIPVAELQAYLLNGVGERLAPTEIQLSSEFGTILIDQPDGRAVVRGRYDGSAAILQGEDLIRASWKRPTGSGGVWDMAVRSAAPGVGDTALLDVRAVDQGGRPLPDVSIEMVGGGAQHSAKTGEFGWASSTFAWPKGASFMVLEASAGGLTRRTFVTRGTRPGPAAGSPDLLTEVLVPIHPGRVHGVILNIKPRTLTNDGMVGNLEVHMEDQAGNRVTGQMVDVSASIGVVGPVTAQPNGSYVAQYAPPIGMRPGRVRLTASTDDGRFSAATDVEVIPRSVDWSLAVQGGYLVGGSGLHSPALGLAFEHRLPVPTLYLRVDAARYTLAAEGRDPKTGMDLAVNTTIVPLGVGTVVRRGLGRYPAWLGGEAVFAPYSLQASFNGVTASDGMGWMSPGASFLAGIAWRTGGGELFIESRYMFLSAPGETIGWVGPVAGMFTFVGYKLLY